MFDLLVECQPRGTRTDAVRGGIASFALHAALIAGAVITTMQSVARPDDPHRPVPVIFRDAPDRDVLAPPPHLPSVVAGPRIAPAVLSVAAIIPAVIPPPAAAPLDPLSFTGVPLAPGSGAGAPGPDTAGRPAGVVYSERWVDERPELLSHPAVAYPDILRQAGIGGGAMIEAVIDTSGRAEHGAIRVLSATHPLFGQPAMTVVAASVFKPGRIDGRAVRVRVRIPIEFEVTARSASMFRTP